MQEKTKSQVLGFLSFKSIDIFGQSITFSIDNQLVYKTKFGGVFSLVFVCVIVLMSFFLGKNFYQRTNPQVLEQKYSLDEHIIRNLEKNNFTIAYKLEDQHDNVLEDFKFLHFDISLINWVYNHSLAQYNMPKYFVLKSKKCNSSEFDHISLNGLNKSIWNCINFNSLEIDFLFGGFFYESDNYYQLQLNVRNCPSEVYDKNNCTDFETLTKYHKNSIYLSFLFNQVTFNYDKENAVKNYFLSYTYQIDPLLKKRVLASYMYGNFTDDRGIFWPWKSVQEFILFSDVFSDFVSVTQESYSREKNDLLTLQISLTKEVLVSKRTYMKIQDLLAILGGFITIVKLALAFLYSFFFEFEKNKFFINKFWEEALNKSNNIKIRNAEFPLNKLSNATRNAELNNSKNKINNNPDILPIAEKGGERVPEIYQPSRNKTIEKNKVMVHNADSNINVNNDNFISLCSDIPNNKSIININRAEPISDSTNNTNIIKAYNLSSCRDNENIPINIINSLDLSNININNNNIENSRVFYLKNSLSKERNVSSSDQYCDIGNKELQNFTKNSKKAKNEILENPENNNNNTNNLSNISDNILEVNNQEFRLIKERKYFDNSEIKNKFNNNFHYLYYAFLNVFRKKQQLKNPCFDIYEIFRNSFTKPLDVIEYIKFFHFSSLSSQLQKQ